jgi:hypothetical protein
MRLLTLVSVLAGSVIGCFSGGSAAWASATHMAKVDVELAWMSPGGRLESVVDRSLDFHLDWGSKKCEVEYKGVFYYCSLETGLDLKDRAGNVLMKELPVARFGYKSMDALLLALGREDDSLRNLIPKIVKETSESRKDGFFLPFYTCESCTKGAGEKVPVWNAYDSFVRRILEIKHPVFSSRRLALVMKIHRMKAFSGAIHIIGRSNADSFLDDSR